MKKKFKIGEYVYSTIGLEMGVILAHINYDEDGEIYRYLVSFNQMERIIVEPTEIISEEEANILKHTR